MSVLSAQVDELRAMAESVGLAMPQAATLMMEAADTIWELRESVRRERAEADRLGMRITSLEAALKGMHLIREQDMTENDKLRELCRRFSEYVSHDRCEGCVVKSLCNDGEVDECWQMGEIRKLARDLGVEVD